MAREEKTWPAVAHESVFLAREGNFAFETLCITIGPPRFFDLFIGSRVVVLARRVLCFAIQPVYKYPLRTIYYLEIIFN